MPDYLVVKLKDQDEDPWVGAPRLWLMQDKDDDDDERSEDDDYDYVYCWWPESFRWYKAKYNKIFNGSTRGWYSRDLADILRIRYGSLEQAEEKADMMNRQELEDKRYNKLKNRLDQVNLTIFNIKWDWDKMKKDLGEMKKILIKRHDTANADTVKPTLENLLPIKNSEDLTTFETRFLTEDWISPALKELIGILTDQEKMNESVSKIMDAIFSHELAGQSSWDEKNRLKIKDLSITKKIDVTLKSINPEYDGFQEAVISWLERNRE